LPDSLRLGFSWSAFSYSGSAQRASRQRTGPAPNPGFPGSRKLSVPGRVHSIPKSCGSQPASAPSGSNPFLTRDTVESPAKLFSAHLNLRRVAAPNQTTGFQVQPLWLVSGNSQKSVRLHCSFNWERRRGQSVKWLKVQPLWLVSDGTPQIHFALTASSGNIRLAS